MSIVGYHNALVNGNTGLPADCHFGEFILKLGARRKDGKIIMRNVEFGMSGPVTGNAWDLEFAASQMAMRIAKLSEGVPFGLYKKLGKYRNDEAPTALACQTTQYGSVIMSNDPRVEDEDAIGPYPLTAKSAKVFVPWLDDETSRQDMKNTLSQAIEVNAIPYGLATSRFQDVDKLVVEVYPLPFVQGVQTKCYNKATSFELVAVDVDEGFGADDIASGAEGVITPGEDDQGA